MNIKNFDIKINLKNLFLIILITIINYLYSNEKIIILHLNDTHSQILQFKNSDGEYVGGFGRISTLIKNIKKNNNTLFFHSGDIFTGSIYSSFYRGKFDIEIMNYIGLDVLTIGNHEFDFGFERIMDLKNLANFKILSANIYFSNQDKTVFDNCFFTNISGIKFAIVGLTTSDLGYYNKTLFDKISIENEIKVLSNLLYLNEIMKTNDVLICITHIGFENDKILASIFPQINFIFGGHSHTILRQPIKQGNTLIMQTGVKGEFLGYLEIFVQSNKIISNNYYLLPVSSSIPEDKKFLEIFSFYSNDLKKVLGEKICYSQYFLDASKVRSVYSPIGNLITDIFQELYKVDIAIINAGGIRNSIPQGDVYLSHIYEMLPFDNYLILASIKGEILRNIILKGLKNKDKGAFLYYSKSLKIIEKDNNYEIYINNNPLNNDNYYKIATSDFLINGNDGYNEFTNAIIIENTMKYQRDIVADYLKNIKIIDPNILDQNPRIIKITNKSNLKYNFYFNNEFFYFNNGDLRALNNTSLSTVEWTDDQFFIPYLEIGIKFEYSFSDNIKFFGEFYKPGFLGNDKLESSSLFNLILTRFLFIKFDFINSENILFDFIMGRKKFKIIDKDYIKSFILNDILDLFEINIKYYLFGFDIFLDFFSMNSPTSSIYDLKNYNISYSIPYFNGDVNTFRFGILPFISQKFENNFFNEMILKPFFLFSRIGAVGSGDLNSGGYEVSRAGTEGNFADNDWLLNTGLTLFMDSSLFIFYLESAYSYGIDRKWDRTKDVLINGFIINSYLKFLFGKIFNLDFLNLSFGGFYISGAETDNFGNFINYGYVSFKGDKVGGFLFKDYYGIYPSGILDYSGIDFSPFDTSKRSPISGLYYNLSIDKWNFISYENKNEGLKLFFDMWFYFDSSTSKADFTLNLPSYINDQRRLGKFMGYEINNYLSYSFYDGNLEIGILSGIFVSYDYFFYPVSQLNVPYGNELFYGFKIFSKFLF